MLLTKISIKNNFALSAILALISEGILWLITSLIKLNLNKSDDLDLKLLSNNFNKFIKV